MLFCLLLAKSWPGLTAGKTIAIDDGHPKITDLRLSKVDAYYAGMATAHHLPGNLCFVTEEYVLSFHLRHNVGMSLHLLTMNGHAVDALTNFDEVGRRALEDDNRISRLHRVAISDSQVTLGGYGSLHTCAR